MLDMRTSIPTNTGSTFANSSSISSSVTTVNGIIEQCQQPGQRKIHQLKQEFNSPTNRSSFDDPQMSFVQIFPSRGNPEQFRLDRGNADQFQQHRFNSVEHLAPFESTIETDILSALSPLLPNVGNTPSSSRLNSNCSRMRMGVRQGCAKNIKSSNGDQSNSIVDSNVSLNNRLGSSPNLFSQFDKQAPYERVNTNFFVLQNGVDPCRNVCSRDKEKQSESHFFFDITQWLNK